MTATTLNAAIAVDLGTNTFHLLVGRFLPSGKIHTLYKRRFYVRLGRAGMHTIAEEAVRAAVAACAHFREQLDLWPDLPVRVMGTAGFRQATNGPQLQTRLEDVLRAPIELLSGEAEARLIATGVRVRVKGCIPSYLMMDIGGGSTEFAYEQDSRLAYADSFRAGVALLKNTFQKHDPILPEEIEAMQAYFKEQFQPVLRAAQLEKALVLIGAAGIFDVLAGIVGMRKRGPARLRQLNLKRLRKFGAWVLRSDLPSRLADARIPPERADLFPAAMVLILWVMDSLPVTDLLVSSFALKEGALHEMLDP